MSQNDFDVANQLAAAFRGDVNSALQALATLSSGASAPATTYAYQLWADTTTGLLKQRNAANSGWLVKGALAETQQGASVAAHATTCDIWASRYNALTGGAVTFTDFPDAPYVGAMAVVVANAAHVLTDGANIEVMGNGNYTCTAGDVLLVTAKTVSTFQVSILRENGDTPNGVNSKVITFTRAPGASTGSVAYTGVGFKPRALIAFVGNGTTNASFIGFCDSALTQYCLWNASVFSFASALMRPGAAGNDHAFVVTSLDADGFTGTWTKTGAPGGGDYNCAVICLR